MSTVFLKKKKKNNSFRVILFMFILLIFSAVFFFEFKNNTKIVNNVESVSYINSEGDYIEPSSYITITPDDLSPNVIGTTYNVTIKFTNSDFQNHKYQVEYGMPEQLKAEEIDNKQQTIKIELTDEGLNSININIKENEKYLCKWVNDVYYIKPYETQFLDELTNKGFSTLIGYPWYADDPSQISLLKALGANFIKDDVRWNIIESTEGNYNYTKYDNWINEAYRNDINIIGILGYGGTEFMRE